MAAEQMTSSEPMLRYKEMLRCESPVLLARANIGGAAQKLNAPGAAIGWRGKTRNARRLFMLLCLRFLVLFM